jgi:hypothetical protein
VTDGYGTVGGGYGNRAGDDAGSTIDAAFATVSGGGGNTASGDTSTVGGGFGNTAGGFASTVPGGKGNVANGNYSFAAGHNASAPGIGSFIWADSRVPVFEFLEDNFFGVRATGGVSFTVAITAAGLGTQFCNLNPGVNGWLCLSDRDAKENFEPARGEDILARLVAMPLHSWNFKGSDADLRNLGPTAQDFHAAFGLGTDRKTIASGNLHGVALAAIQGLNAKLETERAANDAEIAALRAELATIRSVLATIAVDRPTQTAVIAP